MSDCGRLIKAFREHLFPPHGVKREKQYYLRVHLKASSVHLYTGDRCTLVPSAVRARPETTNTSWYINVMYTCDIGHEWPNNKSAHVMTCEDAGSWNDSDLLPC